MNKSKHILLFTTILVTFILQVFIFRIPITGSILLDFSENNNKNLPTLSEFSSALKSQTGGALNGVFVEGVLADYVVQQPPGNPGFVSTEKDTITQFQMASQFGTIGLLAHNTHAGYAFSEIEVNDIIYLIESNGQLKAYSVTEIQRYQALNPTSPYSNFINLQAPGSTLSAQSLFLNTYGRGNVLILQTCIEKNGESSWGRLFVIAEPLDKIPVLSLENLTFPVFLQYTVDAIQIN